MSSTPGVRKRDRRKLVVDPPASPHPPSARIRDITAPRLFRASAFPLYHRPAPFTLASTLRTIMSTVVPFPSVGSPSPARSASQSSLVSSSRHRQATALEVCDLVYGEADVPETDVVDRIYEANAGSPVNTLSAYAHV
jgi:hypothetical protein